MNKNIDDTLEPQWRLKSSMSPKLLNTMIGTIYRLLAHGRLSQRTITYQAKTTQMVIKR